MLAKILRKDVPTSLTLVETNPKESWSAYKINDSIILYIKYASLNEAKKHARWTFTFNQKHLEEIRKYQDGDLRFALICIGDKVKGYNSEICILYKEQIKRLISLTSPTVQRINVYAEKNCPLRVDGTLSKSFKELVVSRNEIAEMKIPG